MANTDRGKNVTPDVAARIEAQAGTGSQPDMVPDKFCPVQLSCQPSQLRKPWNTSCISPHFFLADEGLARFARHVIGCHGTQVSPNTSLFHLTHLPAIAAVVTVGHRARGSGAKAWCLLIHTEASLSLVETSGSKCVG